MADPNPTDCSSLEPASPAADDSKVERTILRFVLGEHPDQITMPEATQALSVGPEAFATTDPLNRAVRELVGAGLLRWQGATVLPTRAALYFYRLETD